MPALVLAMLLLPAGRSAFAQTTPEEFKTRYDRLVSSVGVAGLGVETLLAKWEKAFPDDPERMMASFSFYLEKSQTTRIDTLRQARYLGNAPVLSLKDSLGNALNYFQVVQYDDELFRQAIESADAAISALPDRLDYRLYKISALIGYEEGSPDMAKAEIKKLIDYHYNSHPEWVYPGLEVDDEVFTASIQEYCVTFFKMGTPDTYEAFRELSEKILSYQPAQTLFLTNMGSYYLEEGAGQLHGHQELRAAGPRREKPQTGEEVPARLDPRDAGRCRASGRAGPPGSPVAVFRTNRPCGVRRVPRN